MATDPVTQWRIAEKSRQILQSIFDSQQPTLKRNINGQHATPFDLAYSVIETALSYCNKSVAELSLLEPAIGLGAFYSAFLRYAQGKIPYKAVGFEKNEELAHQASNLWKPMGLVVQNSDFTTFDCPQNEQNRFDILVTNPPYVRHQYIKSDKERLRDSVKSQFGWDVSGLMGLYGYFVLLAHNWMKENAIGAWIIPQEYFDVKYGKAIKRYLLENVELLRIHCFDLVDKKFSGAEVSSSVLFIRKRIPNKGHIVRFTFGPDIKMPLKAVDLPFEKLKEIDKWSLIEKGVFSLNEDKDYLRVKDLFIVKRGVATGANKYFIMTKEQANTRGIPSEFLLPILPGSRYLKNDVIDCDESGIPFTRPTLFLLNCDKSKQSLMNSFQQLHDYILEGEKIGINRRYLTSKRQPWYKQEDRKPAPILCGCIAINRDGRKAIRFYRNTSKAIATNTFFLLYVKPDIAPLITEPDRFLDEIFNKLKSINPEKVLAYGRSYGGGLYKIEPRELENLSIPITKKDINIA